MKIFPALFLLVFNLAILSIVGIFLASEKKSSHSRRSKVIFTIFIFLSTAFSLFFILKGFLKDKNLYSPNYPSLSPFITESPCPSQSSAYSPNATIVQRLDDFTPVYEKSDNFKVNSWSNDEKFILDSRPYSQGIGMQIIGSIDETIAESPTGAERIDCKQVFIDYALRAQYTSLSFSVGADSGSSEYFGDEQSNGIARVMISDASSNTILFDSGWVNYSYAVYDVSIDVSDVDILRITFSTSGIPHYELKTGLRFAIVDPILVLKDDAS